MSRKKGGEDMEQCRQLLKFMQARPDAEPFLAPVDWKALDLPDYPDVISTPMDLGTIETKLNAGKYTSVEKFAADVRLVWQNAKTYNRSDSAIFVTADNLAKSFEKKFVKIKEKFGASDTPDGSPAGAAAAGSAASTPAAAGSVKKRKRTGEKGDGREVSRADRVKFSQLVEQLTSDQLGVLVGMIQKKSPGALNEDDEDELEIEINNISGPVLLELNQYAQECVQTNGQQKKKKR